MIIITGALGFIGSVTVKTFNNRGISNIMLYDVSPSDTKYLNISNCSYTSLNGNLPYNCDMVIHIGANSNTLETDADNIQRCNVDSTLWWARYCINQNIPLVFTSTAAIFGNGTGPLNLYAESKHNVETQLVQLMRDEGLQCAILRLFNVYGPNEYHKGRMASVIYHWFEQLHSGALRIFEKSDEYLRDFVYVGDVAKVIFSLYEKFKPGIYEVGTGRSVSFEQVADVMLDRLGGNKQYIKMPVDLQRQYQKFTQADILGLNEIIDTSTFLPIEAGIDEYLTYLIPNEYYEE